MRLASEGRKRLCGVLLVCIFSGHIYFGSTSATRERPPSLCFLAFVIPKRWPYPVPDRYNRGLPDLLPPSPPETNELSVCAINYRMAIFRKAMRRPAVRVGATPRPSLFRPRLASFFFACAACGSPQSTYVCRCGALARTGRIEPHRATLQPTLSPDRKSN